jgi:hypothetical protein
MGVGELRQSCIGAAPTGDRAFQGRSRALAIAVVERHKRRAAVGAGVVRIALPHHLHEFSFARPCGAALVRGRYSPYASLSASRARYVSAAATSFGLSAAVSWRSRRSMRSRSRGEATTASASAVLAASRVAQPELPHCQPRIQVKSLVE